MPQKGTTMTREQEQRSCPYCKRYMKVLAYMRHAGLRAGMIPTVNDDASWEQLKPDHEPGCYWWATRGERKV